MVFNTLAAVLKHVTSYHRPGAGRIIKKISIDEALFLINNDNLMPICGAWHYSWNIEYFFCEMMLARFGDNIYVFHDCPINEWSPAPLFSNDLTLTQVIAKKGKDCPFWYLKLTEFDEFLERRTAMSSKPRRNFPTKQSYPKVKRKLGCVLERMSLTGSEDLFVRWYDNLKDPKYGHSGAKCLADALRNSSDAPRSWFQVYALIEEQSGACKSVLLAVEDGRSSCGINIASERRNGGGYGVLHDVEVIRDLCSRNFHSYDSGISGRYGNSKDMIFLDTLPTDASGQMLFLQKLGIEYSPGAI